MADVACVGGALAALALFAGLGWRSLDAWLAHGLLAGTKSVGLVLALAAAAAMVMVVGVEMTPRLVGGAFPRSGRY